MSFSDLMSSARGPGVIGMLLALVVLVGFGVLFVFAFDEGLQGGAQTLESVVAGQSRKIEGFESSVTRGLERLEEAPELQAVAKELREVARGNGDRVALIESLRQGISKNMGEITAKTEEFDAYKDEYRAVVRGNAKGQKLEMMETSKGTIYKNVSIREVTAIGMQIRHDGGFRRIPFEELPEEMRDYYQFDPDQKEAAISKEAATRRRHDAAVTVAKGAVEEKKAEQRERMKEAEREKTVRSIALGEARMRTLSEQIRALELALPKESLKSISHAPQMREQIANKKSQYNAINAELSRMKSSL